jgi:predicted ester cyclase
VAELDAIMDPNFIRHSDPATSAEGMVNLKKVINEFKTAYPDIKLVSEEEIYSENRFAGRWSITATNTGPGPMPPTGKKVKFWGINIIHFQNGKMIEEWDAMDTQPFLEQLGFKIMPQTAEKK